jgi:hypothetical protein
MNKLISNINFSSFSDFEKLQNMLIRYLLRNIYFFESTRRRRETNLILQTRKIEMPRINMSNNSIGEALNLIVNSGEYNMILDCIARTKDRKAEAISILKYYK